MQPAGKEIEIKRGLSRGCKPPPNDAREREPHAMVMNE